jgi:hypothetical protein
MAGHVEPVTFLMIMHPCSPMTFVCSCSRDVVSAHRHNPARRYDLTTLVQDISKVVDDLKLECVNLAGHSIAGDEITVRPDLSG